MIFQGSNISASLLPPRLGPSALRASRRRAASLFSGPGCPNPITRLRLRRSRLLPKAHRCFTLPAWAGAGVFSKGCVCNGRELSSRRCQDLILSIPGLARAPPLRHRGFPAPTAAESAANAGKGDGERTAPQNSYRTRTAKGNVRNSGFVLLALPPHAWQGWGR